MPALTITKTYNDDTALTEAQLDSLKDSIETWANTTKLDADNLQDGIITATQLASNAVTQVKLAARTTGTTVAAGGIAVSASCGSYSTGSTSYVDVTNLSVTITTLGRPVRVRLQSDGSANSSLIGVSTGTDTADALFKLVRDSTDISITPVYHLVSGTSGQTLQLPSSMISHDDVVAAGTYVYKLQAKVSSTGTAFAAYAKLVVYED